MSDLQIADLSVVVFLNCVTILKECLCLFISSAGCKGQTHIHMSTSLLLLHLTCQQNDKTCVFGRFQYVATAWFSKEEAALSLRSKVWQQRNVSCE